MAEKNLILSWDEAFMQIAQVMALRSKDPHTQAGAVIVDDDKIVVGLGYNGWVRGSEADDFPWEREGGFLDTKYAYVVHAEENAVYNSNKSTKGCVLYCTLFPCNECTKTIVQKGIKEVVYNSDQYHDTEICQASRKILQAAGIKCRQYNTEYKIDFTKHEK